MITTASRPGGGVEPGGHRDLVPEVAGQRDHRHPLVGLAQLEEQVERAVAAAVVDVDELEVEVGTLVRGGDAGPRGTHAMPAASLWTGST